MSLSSTVEESLELSVGDTALLVAAFTDNEATTSDRDNFFLLPDMIVAFLASHPIDKGAGMEEAADKEEAIFVDAVVTG